MASFTIPGVTAAQLSGNMGGIASAFLSDLANLTGTQPSSLEVVSAATTVGRQLQTAATCPGSLMPGSTPSTSLTIRAWLSLASGTSLQLLFYQGGALTPPGTFAATSAALSSCVGLTTFTAATATGGAGASAPQQVAPITITPEPSNSWIAAVVLGPLLSLAMVLLGVCCCKVGGCGWRRRRRWEEEEGKGVEALHKAPPPASTIHVYI